MGHSNPSTDEQLRMFITTLAESSADDASDEWYDAFHYARQLAEDEGYTTVASSLKNRDFTAALQAVNGAVTVD
jgi:hypothetical protein